LDTQLKLATRFLVSAIFTLSALGKLFDHTASALSNSRLFALPYSIAETTTIVWSIFEAGLMVLIWRPRISRIILAVPSALLGVTLFSYWRGLDCSCFGSLPFLDQLSFGAHLLLLGGMFLGLYYLTISKTEKETPQVQDGQTATIPQSPNWIGLAGVVMMFSAFLTLPFTSSDSRASNHLSHDTVDRGAVEAAMVNHNVVLIDARPDFQYELGYLPGAINIPYDSDNLVELVNTHSLKNQTLIVYCSSAHCNAAELLAEKLRVLGCKKVSIYPGGWEEWVSGREGDGVKRREGERGKG
jgi:rhodanese-related sulfurtransferase